MWMRSVAPISVAAAVMLSAQREPMCSFISVGITRCSGSVSQSQLSESALRA